jgi:type I restriction enzyme S subunit
LAVDDAPKLPVLGTLPTSWQVVELGSVLENGTRNGIYKSAEFHGSGTKMVNMGELFAHPRLKSVPMRRVELTKDEAERFGLRVGDLLFARRSLVAKGAGKCSVVLQIDEPTAFESSLIRARPDPKAVDSLYLYYLFASSFGVYALQSILRQVAVSGITGSDLVRLQIPVPPLSEQRVIAHILGTLDDKIELNRRMSETLEAMARAIFKSWFEDFDPVRAKAEGRQPFGMDAETAALFPDSFQDSPLGKIPRGWRVGSLGDIADNPRRGVLPGTVAPGTPYIGLDHMPRKNIALTNWGKSEEVASNKFRFCQGEILFGKLRPYFHKVGVAVTDGVCSTDILVLRAKSQDWYGLVLGYVSSEEFVNYTDAVSTGTKMPRVNWHDMARYEICLPDVRVASVFCRFVQDSVRMICQNILQSGTLETIRDTLLPKLISGEVRVVQAEKGILDRTL